MLVLDRIKTATSHLARALALVLCLWAANQAKAQVVYTYTANNGPDLTGGFNVTVDGSQDNDILVGGVLMTAASGQGVPGYSDFTTVCTDLKGTIYLGSSYTFTLQGFNGQTGLNPAWGNPQAGSATTAASDAINNAAYIYSAHQNVTTPTDWAALQLAVWKALYDTEANGNVLTTGSSQRFTVQTDPTGAAWNEAQTWLGQLPRNPSFTGYLLYPDPTTQNGALGQEVLVGVSAVPEPATLAAGALLLVPFAISSIRFLRRRPRA
jgi:hypothetical protein